MQNITPLLLTLMLIVHLTIVPAYPADIIINAVGDVMLAGRWAPLLKKNGYEYPFAGVRIELAGADINLANLESPIARCGSECTSKKFRFRAEPAVATALHAAGFNLVTLANNHSMDFGGAALAETLVNLESAGIAWIGAGKNLDEARQMALYTLKGRKVAFLGYSLTQPIEFFATPQHPGTAPGFEKLVTTDVASARKQADFVIVSFHWGKEASGTVQAYQRMIAHKAVDSGADVIIGHHPHVLQGIERYKSGLIFYSLGNFAFASKSKTADVSALVRLRLDDGKRSAEIVPLDVLYRRTGFQPQVLKGKEATAVIDKLNELSRPFKTAIQNSDGRYFIDFKVP